MLHTYLDAAVLLLVALLGGHWLAEQFRLRGFVASLRPWRTSPGEFAVALAGQLSNKEHLWEDPPYLTPLLSPLGGTVSDILDYGACCSGTARLYMLVLGTIGVRSNQITVYHRSGNAQHCLVEVHIGGESFIADPVYGLIYTNPRGEFVALEDLQQGVPVHCRPASGAKDGTYPDDPYYDFDYALTKTANWTMSWQRRTAYAVLRILTRGGVDRLRLPLILEWPQILLGAGLVGALAIGHAIWLVAA